MAWTERGWLRTLTPQSAVIKLGKASRRRWRLLACGCVRVCWDHLTEPAGRRLVEVAEAYAEGRAKRRDLTALVRAAEAALVALPAAWHPPPSTVALGAAIYVGGRAEHCYGAGRVCDWPAQCLAVVAGSDMAGRRRAMDRGHRAVRRVMHDVLGNPFRPVRFDPRWRTADVLGLARGIHEDQAFDRLPLLRDALMDAGCADDQVLGHCDRPVHVRGCWLVDRILGLK